jgi:hypothetical protein
MSTKRVNFTGLHRIKQSPDAGQSINIKSSIAISAYRRNYRAYDAHAKIQRSRKTFRRLKFSQVFISP